LAAAFLQNLAVFNSVTLLQANLLIRGSKSSELDLTKILKLHMRKIVSQLPVLCFYARLPFGHTRTVTGTVKGSKWLHLFLVLHTTENGTQQNAL
jgi:hypothetical protein